MTRVLLAFADTGGGHRAAAEALRDALAEREPTVETILADPYARSRRWPFAHVGAAYPRVINRASWLWRAGFAATNSVTCTAMLQALAWPALRAAVGAARLGVG